MRGRGHLAGFLGAALIWSFGCGPTVVGDVQDEQEDADDPQVWLTMRHDAVPEVEDFLGPISDDGGARLVESANGASILVAFESELEPLGAWFHDRYHRCGGFATHTSLEAARRAVNAEPDDTSVPEEGAGLLAGEPQAINRMLPMVDKTRILATIMGLSSFPTRYYTSTGGVDAANWLRDRWTQLAAGRSDVTVALFPHPGWAQPSVMMTIQGQDLAAEHVIIGGHLDSITFSGATAPGADDDASGVASLTEVARVLLADGVRLRRTVVFIAYAAEEVGLRGSGEIADQFAAEGRQVRGVMQLDMTDFKGSAADIVLFTDYTSPSMTDSLENLATTYLPGMVLSRDACGYACSDHAPWFQNGFATVLPFESQMDEYNPNIHTSGDTLAFLGNNADHAQKFSKLGLVWVVQQARVAGAAPAGVVRLAQVAYEVPGADSLGEFVELYNTGGTTLAVGDWKLRTPQFSRRIPAGTTVPPHGYLTIARDGAGFTSLYGQAPDLAGPVPPLPNVSGDLTLRNAANVVVDQVKWETADWPITANSGSSLFRTVPGGTDSNTAADWSVKPTAPH